MAQPQFDWYLREWMGACEKIQASFVNELGWPKAKANAVWHGEQRYNRDIVNEVSAWLHIKPYELLMHPAEAMALRQLRSTAAAIVAGTASESEPPAEAPPLPATGTR